MSILELATELNFIKLATISQLIKALMVKHGDVRFSLIGDEIDGELFDTKESQSLKHMFETENTLDQSDVVLCPQSLEKHRKFVSPNEVKDHNKYHYEETGIEIFCLTKSMRTSQKNFNFLLEFISYQASCL